MRMTIYNSAPQSVWNSSTFLIKVWRRLRSLAILCLWARWSRFVVGRRGWCIAGEKTSPVVSMMLVVHGRWNNA